MTPETVSYIVSAGAALSGGAFAYLLKRAFNQLETALKELGGKIEHLAEAKHEAALELAVVRARLGVIEHNLEQLESLVDELRHAWRKNDRG